VAPTNGTRGRLSGKVALVTGAARGQGAAEAELFCREGARVVLADLRDAEGEERAEALRSAGHDAIFRHLDVSAAGDWDLAIGAAESTFGPLDVLVNNAGVVSFAGIADCSAEEWDEVIAVNHSPTRRARRPYCR
jgi:NAD(P)-dependent dehydrogenase (short-subunit alcohol dehydrogenase family)